MHSFILLLSLLATLALAAPHAIHHQFLHYNRDLSPSIAGRSISDIGLCGGDSGFVCAEGSCCSQWGYCGTSSDYCGAGCQFGNCDTAASSGVGSVNSTSSSAAATFAPSPTKVFNAPLFSSEAETSSASETSAPVSTSSPISVAQLTTMVTLVSSSAAPPSTSVATTSTSVYVAPSSTSEAPSSTVASGSPSSSPSASGSGQGLGDVYNMYYGDGTASQGWPTLDDWVDFDTLWTNNLQSTISTGCDYYKVPNNSDEENNEIKAAILSTSQSSGIDARYILAIVLQESNGCARVPSSGNGVFNPGLMQDHAGTGTCNGASGILNPCPVSEINQMITEGTTGTSQGPGLLQVLSEALGTYNANDDSKYFVAARLYNSGQNSITNTKIFNLSAPTDGTLCYAMSVANRLTGWFTGLPGCHS